MRRCSAASREAESIYQEAQYLLFRGLGAVYPRFLGLFNSVEVSSEPPPPPPPPLLRPRV